EERSPGPVLGELTGLGLVIGSYDSGGTIDILVLDTGEVFELPGVPGRPVGMVDQSLVASRYGEIFVADLSKPEPEPKTVFDAENGWNDYVEVDDGRIWTIADDAETLSMVAYSVDGELIDSVDLSLLGSGFGWPIMTGASDLVQSSAGGVFRRVGSDFERLSTGRLRTVGNELALVDECDDRLRCRSRWHRVDDWTELDLPAPSFDADAFSTVAGDDRWLLTTNWRSSEMTLTEVATGEVVRTWSDSLFYGYGDEVPISEDGRWLVDAGRGLGPSMVDLDSGTEWPIDIRFSGDAAILIVDLAGTAFAG
ncbi:MAG: hypothetical protein ACR2QK_07260, partial [Acidimicrobiales bacterium]